MKKIYSLVTKEMVNVIRSLLFLALGILKLVNPQNPAGKLAVTILLWVAFAVLLFDIVFHFLVKFDMEDEAALEHYDRAKKKVFDFIWGFFGGAAAVGLFISVLADAREFAVDISVNINAWHLVIVYELLQLAISAHFIYFEKREA